MDASLEPRSVCSQHGGVNPSACFDLHHPHRIVRWVCPAGHSYRAPLSDHPKVCCRNQMTRPAETP